MARHNYVTNVPVPGCGRQSLSHWSEEYTLVNFYSQALSNSIEAPLSRTSRFLIGNGGRIDIRMRESRNRIAAHDVNQPD
jgi:hypothetical protein